MNRGNLLLTNAFKFRPVFLLLATLLAISPQLGVFGQGGMSVADSAMIQEENGQADSTQAVQESAPTAEEPGAEETMGLDARIDKAFKPLADWWGGLIFTTVPIGDV